MLYPFARQQVEIRVGSEAQGRPVVVHPGAFIERDIFPQALAQSYPVSSLGKRPGGGGGVCVG